MVVLSILLAILFVVILPGLCVVMQFERGLVFTLGRYTRTLGPGLNWVIPFIQQVQKIDMRIETVDVPKQEVITKDNIPVNINAVVYFHVKSPEAAVIKVSDYMFAVVQLTQSALKDIVGNNDLDTILSERKRLGDEIREIVDDATDEWGIDIDSINVQEIELPEDMKRAMAKQAEAERNRRAMVITASGEVESSKKMLEAAQTLAKNPITVQLKTLQTIKDISASPSQKVVMFPLEIMDLIKKK